MLIGHAPVVWSRIGFNNSSEIAFKLKSLAVLTVGQGQMKRAAMLVIEIKAEESKIAGIYCPKERRENQVALDSAWQALCEE